MMLIDEAVEMSLFDREDLSDRIVSRCMSMAKFLDDCLCNDYVLEGLIFEHIHLEEECYQDAARRLT